MTLVAGLFLNFSAQSDYDWELKKDKDGIKVYTRKHETSSFKEFKLVAEIEAPNISVIPAVLLDIDKYTEWMPDTEDAEVIKKIDDGHLIYYTQSGAPWPVSDRDGIYEQKATFFKEEKKVIIEVSCFDEYDYPTRKGVVRMTEGSGHWDISEIEMGKFKVIYQYLANPGGSIPAWLANSSVVNIPYRVTVNLKEMVAKGGHDDVELDFID